MLINSIQKIANNSPLFPTDLLHIAQIPDALYILSDNWTDLLQRPRLAVVGSRKVSSYGQTITHRLVSELAQAGVVIVSGLAYGVDSIAHRAALDAGGLTIAVLPRDVQHIYPSSHQAMAQQIIKQGGALVSEYDDAVITYKSNFVARNRLVAGVAQALLVTEAAEKSGSLHTARFALEQGKDVLAVPGNVTSPTSIGTNTLIKSGAAVVTCAKDVLHILGLQLTPAPRKKPRSSDPQQQSLLDLLVQGIQNGDELLTRSQLDAQQYNQALTMLEISGQVRAMGGNAWALA